MKLHTIAISTAAILLMSGIFGLTTGCSQKKMSTSEKISVLAPPMRKLTPAEIDKFKAMEAARETDESQRRAAAMNQLNNMGQSQAAAASAAQEAMRAKGPQH
jgi:hypothetical protein